MFKVQYLYPVKVQLEWQSICTFLGPILYLNFFSVYGLATKQLAWAICNCRQMAHANVVNWIDIEYINTLV